MATLADYGPEVRAEVKQVRDRAQREQAREHDRAPRPDDSE